MSPSPSEQLYQRAYSVHYDDRDFEAALSLYREVIATFPDSVEAGYSRSQIENIEKSLNPPPIAADDLPWATLEDKIKEKFVCTKCGERSPVVKRIAATGAGLTRLLDIQHNQLLMVSCSNCGFAELYDLDVLEGKDVFQAIIDVIIGS